MSHLSSRRRRYFNGHVIRWSIILLLFLFLFRVFYGAEPWNLRNVADQALASMEKPSAEISHIEPSGRGIDLVLLIDQEHGLFHQFFAAHRLNLIWEYKGGGFGYRFDPNVLISFKGGMSTFGKYRHYYYMGQIHDSSIAKVKVTWYDGYTQDAVITDGIYQVARAIRISEDHSYGSSGNYMKAFNEAGEEIYRLDESDLRTEIRRGGNA